MPVEGAGQLSLPGSGREAPQSKRTTAGGSRRRPLCVGAYWLKGTFSQLRTPPASVLLPATVNRT